MSKMEPVLDVCSRLATDITFTNLEAIYKLIDLGVRVRVITEFRIVILNGAFMYPLDRRGVHYE